jgi:hypothetical protein
MRHNRQARCGNDSGNLDRYADDQARHSIKHKEQSPNGSGSTLYLGRRRSEFKLAGAGTVAAQREAQPTVALLNAWLIEHMAY